MHKNSSRKRAFASRLIGSAALASSLGWTASATAQDAAPSSEATEIETIVVTGSHIRKAEAEGAAPVQVLTREDIENSGVSSIGEVLSQLSVSGSALNAKFNSAGNFGFPADGGGVGSGSATVALRQLSAKRTLVLVDGLRWVNESSASGVSAAVDINTIPMSIVDHIEILTDGASAVYGSDAIGGVVNIITKKKQEGIAFNVYGGDYGTGDGKTKTADVSFGGSGDKFDYFVNLSYFDQNGISSNDWVQSRFPVPGTGVAFGSSAIPTTRTVFTPTDPAQTYNGLCPVDADSGVATCNITANGNAGANGVQSFPDGFHQFTGADRFNFAQYNLLLTPSTRKAIFAQSSYQLLDHVKFSVKGLYQNRESINQAAAEPIFIGAGAGTGGLADTVGVDVTNPFNPFGVTLDSSNLAFAAMRPLAGGPRVFSQNVDTLYLTGGLQGDFDAFGKNYNWDAHYIDSTNRAQQYVTGTYNIAHIQRALGPVANCDGTVATGNCVPLNFFGGPAGLTPAMLNYIQFTENDRSEQTLHSLSANVSGPIVTLPAGDLSFAAGYESRRLHGEYSPDSVVTAGETNGVPSQPTAGGYTVDEGYIELSVPLLASMPAVYSLEFDFASRYSDYDTFGDTTNNKYGLRYQPIKDLTLRGTYAEGFRAPTVGELFASSSRFDATIEDPCSGASDAQTIANCQTLGVPGGFEQANTQISVQTGGNNQLKPETSESTTFGFVYSPFWAESLPFTKRVDVELTYFKIKLDDAISALDAQTQLDRCVDTLDDAFCAGITRGSTGDINGFSNKLLNVGTIDVKGFDLTLSWFSPESAFGKFGLNFNGTYMQEYKSVSKATGLEEPRKVGVEVTDSGIPRIRGNLRASYEISRFNAAWTMRYISSLKEECNADILDGFSQLCSDPDKATNRLGAVVYNDARVSYKLPVKADATVAAGVNNVFDKDPPACLSCSLNGYDASLYDLPGTYGYVQASVRY
ncbi:TonB-dependent receptor domain-containing protein [Hydrocarboniphaga sp.]|uniref:TonB-dependent receptor domain-containing protein n=1 Tax=Hydrocarboniphaga sp. TaxID=2033016 RepID=UPI003D104B0F